MEHLTIGSGERAQNVAVADLPANRMFCRRFTAGNHVLTSCNHITTRTMHGLYQRPKRGPHETCWSLHETDLRARVAHMTKRLGFFTRLLDETNAAERYRLATAQI